MIITIYGGGCRDEGKRCSRFRCYESVLEIVHFPFNVSKNNVSIMINTTYTPSHCQEFMREW